MAGNQRKSETIGTPSFENWKRANEGIPSQLLSLCLGIRLKAGGESRRFDPGGDPKGRPTAFDISQNPLFRKNIHNQNILPRVLGEVNLSEARIIETLPKLSPNDEIALMKAARLYQEAIWIAEIEPELSWILLVSAIEVASIRWRSTNNTPLERLRSSRLNILEELLFKSGGTSLVLDVADKMVPFIGLTSKFKDFIIEFLPEPPSIRPPIYAQVEWDIENMKKSLGLIYEDRSRALHDGIPFPGPMCEPPRLDDNGAYSERPIGIAIRMQSATWAAKDTPMLLQTFEYIVRRCLVKWWRTLILNEDNHITQSLTHKPDK